MKNKIIVTFWTILSVGCFQHKLKYNSVSNLEEKHGFSSWVSSSQRDKPITNREFLLFLSWSIEVYGDTYPEYVSRLIPYSNIKLNLRNKEELLHSLNQSTNKYIFNSKLIDYPVLGLDRYQIGELYKWMSDRFAENKLVKLGYLNFNHYQRDEDSFSLESFLCLQYEGVVANLPKPKLSDNIFIANFRPPFQNEREHTQQITYKGKPSKPWRKYKPDKFDFLKEWNRRYIITKKGNLYLNIEQSQIKLEQSDISIDNYKYVTRSFCIKNASSHYSKAKYFDNAKGIIKDKYGKMPFIYVGVNTYNRPIIIESFKFNSRNTSSPKDALLWLFYDLELGNKYWPKRVFN